MGGKSNCRQSDGYSTQAKTSINGGEGGEIIVDDVSKNSPYVNTDWTKNSAHELKVERRQTVSGISYGHLNWSKAGTGITDIDPDLITDVTVNGFHLYTANFDEVVYVTFQNSFESVGNHGQIKVDNVTYSLPHSAFDVVVNRPIESGPITQTYNYIKYTFDRWNDQSSTNPKTFYPTSDITYTAYYIGKPISLYYYNLKVVGNPGDPVGLDWDEHPNTNVTKYYIYRKVKHNGQMGSPVHIATRNRGTTSYTDNEYHLTNGYTDDLLYYDVRAYYSTENTYSDPEWIDVYGEEFAKRSLLYSKNTLPQDFSISNFPNPFNPTTTISFPLIEDSYVSLKVYNISGQEVSSLFTGKLRAGVYKYGWNGKSLNGSPVAGGMYIAKLLIKPKYGERILLTRKMLLTK